MPTRSSTPHASVETKGPSLARGPAWIVGTVLAVFGLILFFEVSGTPLDTGGFPDGAAVGDRFIGFEANAWTAWLTTAAGVVMLVGAAQHAAAKLTSLLVGLALGAASVIALVDGNDVLGLAAANGLTALGWGIAAAVLIVTALLPRLGREDRAVRVDRDAVTDGHRDRDLRDRTAVRESDNNRDVRDRDLRDRDTRDREPVATTADARDRGSDGSSVSYDHRGVDADDHAGDGSEDATRVHDGRDVASTDDGAYERPTEVRPPR